jgi:hypothetical protein
MFPVDEKFMKDTLHLDYTMRVLPHDQNSGGFYVALLRKKGYVYWNPKTKIEDWNKNAELLKK